MSETIDYHNAQDCFVRKSHQGPWLVSLYDDMVSVEDTWTSHMEGDIEE